ncbi:MAG: MotA/TolQ/ExbB proton channel family protein [Ruminococcus sp.]|nr:MotA/TolQ/ExbB proton channel family protein [Ruminococcus sp.]
MFKVIFSNIAGFDAVIFLAGIVNAVVFYFAFAAANELYRKMHLTVFVPDNDDSNAQAQAAVKGLTETELTEMRTRCGKLYSVFVNLTGIFPLLGILGTVASLLSVMDDMSNAQNNFYAALTSTFWGLVFAIIFKFLDGVISAKIEDNEKTVALFLQRNWEGRKAKKDEEAVS